MDKCKEEKSKDKYEKYSKMNMGFPVVCIPITFAVLLA